MSKGQQGFGKHLFVVGATLAATLLFVGYVLIQSGTLPTLGGAYKVDAVVPQAAAMTPGARVVIAGADVGQVASVSRANDVGGNAKLSLEITNDEVTPLPSDSTVEVRTRSQVGENYVAIDVGQNSDTVPDGGTLGLGNSAEHVDVDQILSILSGKTKYRTRRLFQQFGGALEGRDQDLNATVRGVNGLFQHGTETMDVLYPDRDLVAQLVDQLGRVTAAIGDRSAAIDAIANQGVTALRALAQRDQSLAATIDALPPTLQQVKQTSGIVGDVSSRATPVVYNLAAATRELRPAVRDLAPSATAGRGLLYQLAGAAPKLTDTLNSLKNLSNTLPDALGPTKDTFCQLDPALRYIQPRIQELWQIITALGSGANNYDALGHMVELTPMFDQGSLSGTPPAVQTAAHQLLESGLFGNSELRSYEPFIPNGQIGKIVATDGTPGSDTAYGSDSNTTYGGGKYPHVKADCGLETQG